MTDAIIIAIVVVVFVIGLRSVVKRFRSKSSCCSSGTYKAKAKKLDSVAESITLKVDGMTCQHCVNRVMEAVNSIDGASGTVHLKKGTVDISMERHIDGEVFIAAIEKAGYAVIK